MLFCNNKCISISFFICTKPIYSISVQKCLKIEYISSHYKTSFSGWLHIYMTIINYTCIVSQHSNILNCKSVFLHHHRPHSTLTIYSLNSKWTPSNNWMQFHTTVTVTQLHLENTSQYRRDSKYSMHRTQWNPEKRTKSTQIIATAYPFVRILNTDHLCWCPHMLVPFNTLCRLRSLMAVQTKWSHIQSMNKTGIPVGSQTSNM
jgi:hypothetical protein